MTKRNDDIIYVRSSRAMDNAHAIMAITGSNLTATVENALAYYLSLLRHGCIPPPAPHGHDADEPNTISQEN